MPLRYTQRILEHLKHGGYRPALPSAIAKAMRIERDDRPAFDEAISMLAGDARVEIGSDGKVRLPSFGDEVVGVLRLTDRGFGFVRLDSPSRDGDLFVPQGRTGDAISGDRVRCAVRQQAWRAKSGRSPFVGQVIEVIERGQEKFVGVLHKQKNNWLVIPDGRALHDPVVVRDPHAKNAKEGDKVVLELMHYPEEDYLAEGVIVEVLGEAGKPDVETQAVITAHGLREGFDEDMIAEAREAVATYEAEAKGPWPDRLDLTEQLIWTIDPPDAKDFDDAISLEYDEGADEWTLGVHIADVARFVKAGGALDNEAQARANSVYLPRHVIPMLPELLSNGICSLQEGVERFAKSVFITFDGKGRVMHQRAAATVIKSRKRLTYLEAQALIDGDVREARKHSKSKPVYDDDVVEALRLADRLAKTLRKRRHADGMIVLNLPEVELVFDPDGNVTDAVPEDDAFTHTIIEMFMVEANEALARLFAGLNLPLMRRIHPEPVSHDLTELQAFVGAIKQRIPENPDRRDLQKLLEATRNEPVARAIHFAVLKTLTKATYSPAMIGHFALASDHYAHFTSPIRRYPDLTVHRALQAWLDLTDNGTDVPGGRKRDALARRMTEDARVLDEGKLIELGRHCSDMEVEAEQAERELRSYLVMKFLAENHLGDEFDAVVTGVAGRGLYVSIDQFLVEGMVSVNDMPSSGERADRWNVSDATGRLTAQRSGASVGLGDVVRVKIAQVDLASRHLDLALVELPRCAFDADTVPARGHGHGRGRGKSKRNKKPPRRRQGRRRR